MRVLFISILIAISSSDSDLDEWKHHFRFASAGRPGPNKKNPKGEDAYYVNDVFMVVADGVGGWANRGIDPSLYSNKLVDNCKTNFYSNPQYYSRNLKLLGNKSASSLYILGSSTLVMVALDPESLLLHTNNIGDSGYMILRKVDEVYQVIFKSSEQ